MFQNNWQRGNTNAAGPVFSNYVARRILAFLFLSFCSWLSPSQLFASGCVSIQEAAQHVGETACVAGKVLRVSVGNRGVHFLEFCEEQPSCPFYAVVFASGLKDVGDVRRLVGRSIELHGAIKLYEGRPEIILNRISQITGGAAMIPPLPKNYDVENRGHFSAGRLHPSKKLSKKKAKTSPSTTATYGNDVECLDSPE